MKAFAQPPQTGINPVVDRYHGIDVVDPYRWLEDQNSPETRGWIQEQTTYAREYLDALPHREAIRNRVAELFAIESIPAIRYANGRCFFLRQAPREEQARLYVRNGLNGEDRLLLDPVVFAADHTISLTIIDATADGRLLALGLRRGGGGGRTVRLLDTETGGLLPEELPAGAVRGFSFLAEGHAFLYVVEQLPRGRHAKTAKIHRIGEPISKDRTIFHAGIAENIRLISTLDRESGIALHQVMKQDGSRVLRSAYLQRLGKCGKPLLPLYEDDPAVPDLWAARGLLWLKLKDRPLATTPLDQPDLTSLETRIPADQLQGVRWRIAGDRLILQSDEDFRSVVRLKTIDANEIGELPLPGPGTVTVLEATPGYVFYTWESYTNPPALYVHDLASGESRPFDKVMSPKLIGLEARRLWAASEDGTNVPITALGKPDTFERGNAPTVLTGYGAAGISLTPKFSQLATFVIENRGIFALAHIRGGGELGESWREGGSRHNRPNSFADFVASADFLIREGITHPKKLAIAGGSNSGLLVGAALCRRPDLFRCVICIAPILDMLRYHLFQNTQFYIARNGSPDDPEDFQVLASYSPYHQLQDGTAYPAMLMVSGDRDNRCDPMHARKFVARLQAASTSGQPVLLDYSELRGHWPVLPFSFRVNALTDRIAFLVDQLRWSISQGGG